MDPEAWAFDQILKIFKIFKIFKIIFNEDSIKSLCFWNCFSMIPYWNPLEFESPTTKIWKDLGNQF